MESDYDIERRISERFTLLQTYTESCIRGNMKALIVSGDPGLGKSYIIEKTFYKNSHIADMAIIKGFTRPTGLFKVLYTYRHAGCVVLFDDCDSVYGDVTGLQILKAALDTSDRRIISYLSERALHDDESGEIIPKSFEFKGAAIFATNLDFEKEIKKGNKLSIHIAALMSRAHYLDMNMKTRREYLVRIRQVIRDEGISNCSWKVSKDILAFIEKNYENFRELSLRTALKLADLYRERGDWEHCATITMMK
jgi:hypothetical protein